MVSVALITVNYHSTSLIRRLESIVDGQPDLKLYVVDNSGNFVTPYATTNVIQSGGNIGFGRACNLGAACSREDQLFFINPDLEIDLASLRALVVAVAAEERAIVGPLIDDGSGMSAAIVKRNSWLVPFERLGFALKDASDHPSLYVSGACLCISRELFFALGGFYDRIFMYGEDLDLCLRASAKGCKVVTYYEILVRHFSGTASTKKQWPLLRLVRWSKKERLLISTIGHYRFLRRYYSLLPSALTAIYLARGSKRNIV